MFSPMKKTLAQRLEECKTFEEMAEVAYGEVQDGDHPALIAGFKEGFLAAAKLRKTLCKIKP